MAVPTSINKQCINSGELVLIGSSAIRVCVNLYTPVQFNISNNSNDNNYYLIDSYNMDSILKLYSIGNYTFIKSTYNTITPIALQDSKF